MNMMQEPVTEFPAHAEPKETTFVFDHIPKTGGTALRAVFEEIFGAGKISPHVSTRSESWARQNFSSYRMVTGHFLPLRNESPDDGRIRLTILRHPFERAISEYYWYRHDTDAVAGGDMAPLARAHEFDEYLVAQENRKAGINPNVYARHFASQLTRDLADETQLLSLAKEGMSRYQFVGITENLTDTVDFFCCEYGLRFPAEVPRLNTTSSRKAVSDLGAETLRRLELIYALDLELYRLALTSFQNRKRQILQTMLARQSAVSGNAASVAGVQDRHDRTIRSAEPVRRPERGRFRPVAWLQNIGSRRSVSAPQGGRDTSTAQVLQKPNPGVGENFGNMRVEFVSATISGETSGPRYVHSGEMIRITLVLRTRVAVRDLTIGIAIVDSMGEIAFGTNTHLLGASISVLPRRCYEVTFRCRANLNKDYYFLNASAHTGAVHTNCCFHWREHITELDVVDSGVPQFEGYVRLEPEVTWSERQAEPGQ